MARHELHGIYEKLRWLDGNRKEDYNDWLAIWESTAARRPQDHPGYLRAMRTEGLFPAAAYFEHETGARILYTFYWKSLSELPFNLGTKGNLHLVSPYGYGGPLYEGAEELQCIVSQEFEVSFSAEAARRGVVSEFVRENLFQEGLAIRTKGEHLPQQPNVAVRLRRDAEDVWRSYEPKVRKNVNRARQHGLRVVFDETGSCLDQFLTVYYDTMTRKDAADSFYFGRDRFELLIRTLGAAGGTKFVHVLDGDTIISTELLLLSSDTIYSFLGGTLATHFDKRPNDLLKHEVIMWGIQHGFAYYVLGGGVSAGDGIFRYKKAFDPEGIYPFFVRRIQHNRKNYNLLLELRRNYENALGRIWTPREDFFPAYLS